MATVTNVLVYPQDWAAKLQEQLDEGTKWKDICNVIYTDSQVVNFPYHADATVQTNLRGTAYTYQAVSETNESVTINTSKILPQFIDRADLAQSHYARQMELAERQGILLNEAIETDVYTTAGLTSKDNSSLLGGAAGSVIVSPTNVDDILRGIVREVQESNGQSFANRYGLFAVWKPAHFEHLVAYAQANGYQSADEALVKGAKDGFYYGGITHYTSNLLPTDKMIAGVKKAIHLYILRATYGQIMVNDKDPASTSGISVVSRVDYKSIVWNNFTGIVYKIDVG